MPDVEFNDNSKEVITQLDRNVERALTAVGMAAEEVVLDYMTHNYYKDIHLTGDLKRDVNFKVDAQGKKVMIGNSLNYAIRVHEGTGRMKKRPYLYDAITQNTDIWQEIFVEYLGEGFGKVYTGITK